MKRVVREGDKVEFKRGLRHRRPKPPLSSCLTLWELIFRSLFNPPLLDVEALRLKAEGEREEEGNCVGCEVGEGGNGDFVQIQSRQP